MNRNYLSGAQKRKKKAEKNELDRKLLEKVPKISDIFRANSSERSETPSAQSSLTIDNRIETESGHDTESVLDSDVDNFAESSFGNLSIASSSSFLESNDPGLWNIQSNQISLQTYWTKHGKIIFLLPNCRKIKLM